MTPGYCNTCKHESKAWEEKPCKNCNIDTDPHSEWEPALEYLRKMDNNAVVLPDAPQTEAVSHPAHYNREGSMECIDEMLLIFGREAVMHFCLLNAWKYRYRAADKNGAQDLAKSDWYLRRYRELQEET